MRVCEVFTSYCEGFHIGMGTDLLQFHDATFCKAGIMKIHER